MDVKIFSVYQTKNVVAISIFLVSHVPEFLDILYGKRFGKTEWWNH